MKISLTRKNLSKKKIYVLLLSLVVLITTVLLILPILPSLPFLLNKPDNKIEYDIPTSYAISVSDNPKPIPSGHRLVIPKIGVDTPIVDGNNIDILNSVEGVWREIKSRSPETPGNMTLAGHRFQYLPPNSTTFYNLDKLEEGDNIIVFWDSKTYIYKIFKTFEVTPDHVEILNDSDIEHEITLYTCTPVYTSTDRLVVKAKLVT